MTEIAPEAEAGSTEIGAGEPEAKPEESEEVEEIIETTETASSGPGAPGASGTAEATGSSSQATLGYLSYIVLLILGSMLIALGVLGLNVVKACPDTIKAGLTVNHAIISFSLGMGVGIIAFLILNLVFSYSTRIPLILLSLLTVLVGSINVSYLNSNDLASLKVFNVALIGLGAGLFISFAFSLVGGGVISSLRFLALFLSIAIIVFTSVIINTFNSCDKPEQAAASNNWAIFLLVIAIIMFILVAVSFYFYP